MDFNQVDWDKRTPLHYAVKGKSLVSVKYLLSVGSHPASVDRWGLTPINYALNDTDIMTSILTLNRTLNTTQVNVTSAPWNITDNDVRLFYAAYNGDLPTA